MTALENSPNQIGPYQILAELGKGGMSFVYQAIDTRAETQVALKVLPIRHADDPAYIRRFVREGINASRLKHPNIVPVYEAAQYDDYHVIAMELLEGGTLTDYLRGQWDLLKPQIPIGVIKQLADGLDYAHRQGFLHRDIKPSNILLSGDLLDPSTRILISDFGVARRMSSNDMTAVTQTGYTVGTPNFMSPEQAKGEEEIDHRSDIYGLGAVAYVLFTGKMPFKADTQLALMHKVVYEPPTPPEELNPNIPPGIAYAIKRVLAKDPNQRYNSALEFAEALREGLVKVPSSGEMAALEASAYPIRVASTRPPQIRKRKRAVVSTLVTLFGAAMALLFLLVLPVGQPVRQWLGIELIDNEALPPIVLSAYVDPGGHFRVEVPNTWTLTEADRLTTFDSTEFVGRLFVQRQPLQDQPSQATIAQTSINHAQSASITPQLLEKMLFDYISQPNLPFKNLVPVDDGILQIQRSNAAEGRYHGSWLGVDVKLRLVAAQASDGQNAYVIGSVMEIAQEENFGHLADAVFGSFTMINRIDNAVAQASNSGESDANDVDGTSSDVEQGSEKGDSDALPLPTVTRVATQALHAENADAQVAITPTPSLDPTAIALANSSVNSAQDNEPNRAETNNGESTEEIIPTPTTEPLAPQQLTATTEALQKVVEQRLTVIATRIPSTTPADASATSTSTVAMTRTPTSTPQPTETEMPAATNTATRTATRRATATSTTEPTLTATKTKAATSTNTVTPTNTPAQTTAQSGTSVLTPSVAAAAVSAASAQTSTPTVTRTVEPTKTATPTATSTSTVAPTATSTVTVTSTSTPMPTQTSTATTTSTPQLQNSTLPTQIFFPTITPTSTTAPVSENASVLLIGPRSSILQGEQNFRWISNVALRPGQLFELVFWEEGQDPIVNGFGPVGAKAETSLIIDMDEFAETFAFFNPGQSYQWGILLVTESPYRRLRFLGGSSPFRFETARGDSAP